MQLTDENIREFFSNYAKALSARDIKAIARCWAAPSFVLSDGGAIPVSKIEEVEAFFASSMDQYMKVAVARPVIKSVLPRSKTMAGCQVAWEHLDEAGESIGGEAGYYMLRHDGKALRIHVYAPVMA